MIYVYTQRIYSSRQIAKAIRENPTWKAKRSRPWLNTATTTKKRARHGKKTLERWRTGRTTKSKIRGRVRPEQRFIFAMRVRKQLDSGYELRQRHYRSTGCHGCPLKAECTKAMGYRMYREIAPFRMVGGTSILPKDGFIFCDFRRRLSKLFLLKAAERTERLWKSGSGRLGLRIFTVKGNK
ncbi:hypothetical protein PaeBR_10560 [Paenibacillus sp. BR2-3]|uniref:hypothetical protein n=1 Tax=Paenibacillus sp. BR2-3 TaxID=3048494 RepID=UPI003977615C